MTVAENLNNPGLVDDDGILEAHVLDRGRATLGRRGRQCLEQDRRRNDLDTLDTAESR